MKSLFLGRISRLLAIPCTGAGMSAAGLIMRQLCMNKFVSPTTGATLLPTPVCEAHDQKQISSKTESPYYQ